MKKHDLKARIIADKRFRGNERLILLALAEFTNEEKGDAWPSIRTLANYINASRSVVLRCLKRLKAERAIIVDSSRRTSNSNRYRLRLPPAPQTSGGAASAASGLESSPSEGLIQDHRGPESGPEYRVNNESEQDASRLNDPMAGLPVLRDAYPSLCGLLKTVHPHVCVPSPGSKLELAAQDTLRRLVQEDGYAENDIVSVLRWLYTSKSDASNFWRKTVLSLGALRSAKPGDVTKFDKLYAQWLEERRASGANLDAVGSGLNDTQLATLDAAFKARS